MSDLKKLKEFYQKWLDVESSKNVDPTLIILLTRCILEVDEDLSLITQRLNLIDKKLGE